MLHQCSDLKEKSVLVYSPETNFISDVKFLSQSSTDFKINSRKNTKAD